MERSPFRMGLCYKKDSIGVQRGHDAAGGAHRHAGCVLGLGRRQPALALRPCQPTRGRALRSSGVYGRQAAPMARKTTQPACRQARRMTKPGALHGASENRRSPLYTDTKVLQKLRSTAKPLQSGRCKAEGRSTPWWNASPDNAADAALQAEFCGFVFLWNRA